MSHPIRVHSNEQPTRPVPFNFWLKQKSNQIKKVKVKTIREVKEEPNFYLRFASLGLFE
jgi:hypothetical protein